MSAQIAFSVHRRQKYFSSHLGPYMLLTADFTFSSYRRLEKLFSSDQEPLLIYVGTNREMLVPAIKNIFMPGATNWAPIGY